MNYILDKKSYSSKDIAQMLGVHHQTIRRYLHKGLIKGFKLNPTDRGEYRVYQESLAEFLRGTGASVEIKLNDL